MGLFGKKKEAEMGNIPKLPELPKIPGQKSSSIPMLPDDKNDEIMNFNKDDTKLHQLPSFPSSNLGNKFSQETIKNAISREEADEEMGSVVPQLPQTQIKKEFPHKEISKVEAPKIGMSKVEAPKIKEFKENKLKTEEVDEMSKPKHKEPVFVRIDKFEESLKIFSRVKEKVSNIEKLLTETKELKNKEEEELDLWKESIQKLKLQIEKVDEDIFSKIE